MLRLALLAGLVAAAAPATAAGFQDTTLLDRAVASFTGHARGEEGGARAAVDPRLKLASCAMVSLAWYGTRHEAVQVTCQAPNWHLYVPVLLTGPAPAPNAAAPALAVATTPVIRRGDPITVEAGSPGFSITREGVALGDAAKGGRLMVKVEDAKMPIQAVALEPGHATLPGWDG